MLKKLLLFLALLPLMKEPAIAASPEQAVMNAARQSVNVFLEKIPVGKELLYGFKSRDEFRLAAIGDPYRMVKLNEDFYFDKILTGKNYLSTTDEWRVPVSVNGDDRLLLTVIRSADAYQVVDLGGAQLAKELQQLKSNHPDHLKKFILRVYLVPMDFMISCPGADVLNNGAIYPMAITRTLVPSLQRSQKETFSVDETLSLIKELITQHQ